MRLIVNPKYEDNAALMRFLRALPAEFDSTGSVLWNKRNQIRRFVITSLTLVVKKYKRPNVIQKIGLLFRRTKAEKAYRNGLELMRRGFLTPEPVACLEIKGRLFIKETYLVTLNTDWPPIADALDRPDWNKSLATAFAQFVARLHQQGVLHNDLNKTNVLYNVGAGISFQLIDNNRMRFLPLGQTPSPRDCMENLTRFTGDLVLFSFVAEAYVRAKVGAGFNACPPVDAWLRQKRCHDRRWRLKKAFAHPIRTLKQMRR